MKKSKRKYVNELVPNTVIEDVFVLSSKELRTSRQKKTYLVMTLSDKTGSIVAYHFAPSSYEADIPVGSPVSVRGIVGTYRDKKKITIEALAPADNAEPSQFLASSTRSTSQMLDELRMLVAKVKEPKLGALLRAIFADKDFLDRFCTCPASQDNNHAYVAGLLEHTVSVATLCSGAAAHYPQANEDILVSAAILHDIGQVDALEYDTTIRQSPQGKLLGHTMLGLRRVKDAAQKVGILESDQTMIDLEHAIASHLPEQEGGIQRPATLEALILFDINAQDVRIANFIEATRGAMRAEERWTTADNFFNRSLQVPHRVFGDSKSLDTDLHSTARIA